MEAMRLGMLAYSYHANELYPFAFLLIGGCLATVTFGKSRSAALWFVAATVLFCFVPFLIGALLRSNVRLPYTAELTTIFPLTSFTGNFIESLWMFAGGALLSAVALSRKVAVSIAFIAFLSLISIYSGPRWAWVSQAAGDSARANALAIYDMSGFVDRYEPKRLMPIWWELNDPNWQMFVSFGEMTNLRWEPLHKPPELEAGKRILFLSSNGRLPKIESRLIGKQPFRLVPVATEHVQRDALGVDMLIADVTDVVTPDMIPDRTRFDRVAVPLSKFARPVIDGHISIATSDNPWESAKDAAYVIAGAYSRPHATTAYVHVRLRTETGVFGTWVTTDDGKKWFGHKATLVSSAPEDVYLQIPAHKNAQIVFGNGGTTSPSTATIFSVDILYEHPGARQGS